jgi:hypothetical protein
MTPQEINGLSSLFGAFSLGGIVFSLILFLFIKFFIPSYFSQKAKNLATREDIAKITEEVERVKSQYAVLIEELRSQQQLRMAAIDRRLQAHQEAFTLWHKLVKNNDDNEFLKTIMECQDWWSSNCLYLEPEVRQEFLRSYHSANLHRILVRQQNSDSATIQKEWSDFMKFPDILFKAIALPSLTITEIQNLEISDTNPKSTSA